MRTGWEYLLPFPEGVLKEKALQFRDVEGEEGSGAVGRGGGGSKGVTPCS